MNETMEKIKNWDIKPGNIVKVWQKIKEGDKTRLQAFEGVIIAHKHGYEPGATFTVRKVASGVGVERIFPLFSPSIEKVDLVRASMARRSKLYYVRIKTVKDIKKKMKYTKAEALKSKASVKPKPKTKKSKEVVEAVAEIANKE
ncbi:TPA: 50S ribosomal protein L19 [Patescibacteria group bacterium]|nr:MAG: 50S ribosomal protein L19 [Parcubacteria group bacterium GW2011_GWF2_40_10]KKR46863.1 MAG: 50S ribosomal protein L19 [Parcubacteria group bacterium GW2011_GWA2_40_143]KKR60302.1 MAG: 50S ribosomal protein L19 [Parcubacteria group bacterium GW2011_GWC2_40_31]KKR75345.1 MAG: 50S ribosomal protein L19 [Parcubacteria group bacterium GW2011_GWB2_40_8]KKR75738.1 MAG: 50S ribosomal protein L19 [Parcubacteria group bacterium GW2011_GWE2_40_8]KKR82411.1 MAG: 50S ribosomal protein L19 [Parcubact